MLEHRPDTVLDRLADWFDPTDMWRLVDRTRMGEFIRVEETVANGKITIKAELPGIDPDKDVEITLRNGVLAISATRSAEETGEKDGTKFSEFRYGSFHRTLAVPKEANATDVAAEYKDGILTITVPIPAQKAVEATKVPVTRS
jgi:HSP20 family protein